MNAFFRNWIKIGGIAILIGLFFVAIGYSLDDKVFHELDNGDLFFIGSHNVENNNDITQTDLKTSSSDASTDGNYSTKLNEEDLKNIKSLNFNIKAGSLSIKEGDDFSISVNESGKEYITSKVKNGVWSIEDTGNFHSGISAGSTEINIFGIKIKTDGNYNYNNQNSLKVTVTLPKEFIADNLDILVGAGSCKADKLNAKNANVDVGAGSCRIDELIASEQSSFTVGAGEVVINSFEGENVDFDCSVGSIKVDGIMNGKNEVECSVGSVKLNLKGDSNDYNYEIHCKVGQINLNGTRYSGLNQNNKINNEAQNSFDLNCDVGTIELQIKD